MNNPANNKMPGDRAKLNFALHCATDDDFAFARRLYMNSMRPLLTALGAWDRERAEAAFKGYFIADEVKIVKVDGVEIGWFQVSKADNEFCLDQVHLIEEARGRGIGAKIISDVIDEAASQGCDVSLSLVKGNPSIRLYERLGFILESEDETKFHMRRRAGPSSLDRAGS